MEPYLILGYVLAWKIDVSGNLLSKKIFLCSHKATYSDLSDVSEVVDQDQN